MPFLAEVKAGNDVIGPRDPPFRPDHIFREKHNPVEDRAFIFNADCLLYLIASVSLSFINF